MPSKQGVVTIHGKEYKTVAKRVDEFRQEHKAEMAIVTKLVSIDEKTVVMKAEILDKNERVVATGFAEENRESSLINRTSALENCETSAIGRALANFGLAGGEYASADEVASAINQQDKMSKDKRLDFDEIREKLSTLDDIESVKAYWDEISKISQSPAQKKYITGMFSKRKKELGE